MIVRCKQCAYSSSGRVMLHPLPGVKETELSMLGEIHKMTFKHDYEIIRDEF